MSLAKEWYVVFKRSEYNIPWWQKIPLLFSPRDFWHVFLFAQSGQFIQLVETYNGNVDITIIADEDDPRKLVPAEGLALLYVEAGYHVVRIKLESNLKGFKLLGNLVPSCVSVVKVVIGLANFVVTPYGLYKWLVENGGEIITSQVYQKEVEC